MRQVLMLNFDQSETAPFVSEITHHLEVNLILRNEVQEVISLLDIKPNIKLLIANGLSPTEIKILSDYLRRSSEPVSFLLIGENDPNLLTVHFMENKSSVNDKVKTIASLLRIPIQKISSEEEDYSAIPIEYFSNLNNIFCDVYIRIKKLGQKSQFVKRILAHDDIDNDLIKRFVDHGTTHLYIPSQYRDNFTIHYANQTISKLRTKKEAKGDLSLDSSLYNVLQRNLIKGKCSKIVMELTQESIRSMQESIKSNQELSDFYELMHASSCNYRYKLNYLTALVLHNILNYLPWSKNEHRIKLTYAAFFNDIMLDNEKLLKIRDQHSLDQSLNLEERLKVQRHALNAIEMLQSFEGIPAGVETIIREHHGDKNGLIFKEVPDIGISPLSRIFMIAEEFSVLSLANEFEEPDIPKIILELKRKFPNEDTLKFIRILEDSLI